MPTVPLRNRTTQISAPQVNTPNVGNAIPGAFGEDVARAQVGLGEAGLKVGTTLIEHMNRQRYYREEAIGDDAGNKLDNFAMKASYSKLDEDIEIPGPNGTTTAIKGGWLNTSGYGADKVYQKGTQALDAYANNTFSSLKSDVAKRKFIERYNSTKETYSKAWLAHEAKEMKNGDRNNLMETIATKLTQLPMLDEVKKQEMIAGINKNIDEGYAKDLLTFEQVKNEKDNIWDEVFRQDAKLYSNEDMAKRVKGGQYKWSNSKKVDDHLSILNHYRELDDKNTVINKIDNRFNLVTAIANGKESIYEPSRSMQAIIDSDDVLSAAVAKARQSRKGYDVDAANEDMVAVWKEASEATDREALSNLATSLIYRKKDLTADQLGLVLFYAGKKADNLRLSKRIISPIGSESTKEDILTAQMDAGINAITRWAKEGSVDTKDHGKVIFDYMEKIKSGAKPYEALTLTINEANLRLHTGMVGYPKEGQLVLDPKGNMAMAYPDGTVKSVSKPMPKPKTDNKKETNKKEEPILWESI